MLESFFSGLKKHISGSNIFAGVLADVTAECVWRWTIVVFVSHTASYFRWCRLNTPGASVFFIGAVPAALAFYTRAASMSLGIPESTSGAGDARRSPERYAERLLLDRHVVADVSENRARPVDTGTAEKGAEVAAIGRQPV
jgi:hypothetical protein